MRVFGVTSHRSVSSGPQPLVTVSPRESPWAGTGSLGSLFKCGCVYVCVRVLCVWVSQWRDLPKQLSNLLFRGGLNLERSFFTPGLLLWWGFSATRGDPVWMLSDSWCFVVCTVAGFWCVCFWLYMVLHFFYFITYLLLDWVSNHFDVGCWSL